MAVRSAWCQWTIAYVVLNDNTFWFRLLCHFITGRFTTCRFNAVGSSCGRFIPRSIQHRSIHPRAEKQLAHVAVEDVLDAFEELATAMPQHQGIDELLTYFEHTYIRGRRLPGRGHNYRSALFPPASRNKRESATEGIARILTTTSEKDGITVFSLFSYATTHPCGHFLMELWKRLRCKLSVSFRQLLQTSTEEKVQSAQRTCQTCNMDEQIVWHSCVLCLTCRGSKR